MNFLGFKGFLLWFSLSSLTSISNCSIYSLGVTSTSTFSNFLLLAFAFIWVEIGSIHCNAKVKPEHYPIVGKHLLGAIKEVLADEATEDIINAWAKAYEVLSEVFINNEKNIYAEIS